MRSRLRVLPPKIVVDPIQIRALKALVLVGIIISLSVLAYYMGMTRLHSEWVRMLYEDTLKHGSGLTFSELPEPLSRLSGTHPRLYMTQDKISELRTLIEGPYRELWLNERTWVDEELIEDRPPAYSTSGEMLWQRTVGDRIPHYAFCYLMTQNETYLKKAKGWVLSAISYPGWGPNADLAKAHLLCGVSVAYDWLYHNFTPQEREAVRDRIALEARLMFLASVETEEHETEWWRRAYLQNHLWVNLCGLGTAGFALYGEVPDAEMWINQADTLCKKVLDSLADDGASHEGVEYWSYGTLFLIKYLDLAKQLLGKGDLFDSLWLRETVYYRLHCMLPRTMWGSSPGEDNSLDFADSVRHDTHGPVCVLRKLAAEYENGYAQWLAREIQDSDTGIFDHRWLNLIWYDPAVAPTPPANLPTMRHFDNLDLVTMRSDWSGDETLFAFKCGPYIGHKALEEFDYDPGGGHVHPDVNHFVLIASGEWLVVDDGYVDKRTDQHNTVLVNGHGQLGGGDRWFRGNDVMAEKRTSAIIRAESNLVYDYVIGDSGNIYPDHVGLEKFLRHVIYLKPDIFIIIDELKTITMSTFDWLLHYEGSLQKTSEEVFEVTNGDVVLDINIIRPYGFKHDLYQKTAVRSATGDRKDMATLELSPGQRTRQTVFLVVLHPAKTGEPHPIVTEIVEDGRLGLIILQRGTRRKLLFSFDRPKDNSRIFDLVGEAEPRNVYSFSRVMPPISNE